MPASASASASTASSNTTAVVTGVSSGIGRAVAAALIEDGWRVFGSVRKENDAAAARAALGERFTPLVFDVTDADGVADAAREVENALQGASLSALVNNAGVAVSGPVQHLPLDDIQRQFDVNLFGAIRTIQAFLPVLGADRRFKGAPGRIVNMSSVAGKIATPFFAPYAMSKHALEALSDALRRELLMHGIDVIVIGPGTVKTPIWAKADRVDYSQYRDTAYYDLLERARAAMSDMNDKGLPADAVGRLVRDALNAPKPKTRYAVMKDRLVMWTLPRLLPTRLLDRILAGQFGIEPRDKSQKN